MQAQESRAPGRAATNLAQVNEYQPWRAELWEQMGVYALQGGELQAAIDHFERGKKLMALSPDGYLALGDAYKQIDNLDEALQAWDKALQSGVGPVEVYNRLLEVHISQNDFSAVVADLRELVALRPADVQLRYTLGLHLAARQPLDALAHLVQVSDMDPVLKPQVDVLVSSIRTAQRADDPAYTLLEAGRALASIGEWSLAVEAFEGAVKLNPDFAEAWVYLGEARQHLEPAEGDPLSDLGLTELQKGLALDPDSLVGNTLLVLYWQRNGQTEKALDVLKRIIQTYPDNPALLAELGNALAHTGDLGAAQEAFQAAVELEPRNADYWRLLAFFSARYEHLVEQVGLPGARQAVALEPNNPANLDMLGQVLLLLEDFASAERFFQRAVQADQTYAPAHVHLGLIYILGEERGQAYDIWTQVLELDPDSPAAEQARRLLDNYFP